MHVHKHLATCVLSGALAAAVPFCLAQSQTTQHPQQPQQGQAGSHPSRSMASASQRAADLLNTINKTEIDGAQSIQDHVQNPAVKSYAQDLVNDHKNLQDQLEDAASKANLNLNESSAMKKQAQREDQRWNKEQAPQAAHSFVTAQIRDHERAIKRLQRLEPQITDPQLKTVVQNAIPVLQKHLSEARKLASQMKSGSSSGGFL
ncbi:MAG: DUF4142 domain-containing protein [Terriglobales bacterium]